MEGKMWSGEKNLFSIKETNAQKDCIGNIKHYSILYMGLAHVCILVSWRFLKPVSHECQVITIYIDRKKFYKTKNIRKA